LQVPQEPPHVLLIVGRYQRECDGKIDTSR
jgi:hypothetical protein